MTRKSRSILQKPQRKMPDLPDIFISVKKRSLGRTDLLKKKKKAEQWSS